MLGGETVTSSNLSWLVYQRKYSLKIYDFRTCITLTKFFSIFTFIYIYIYIYIFVRLFGLYSLPSRVDKPVDHFF